MRRLADSWRRRAVVPTAASGCTGSPAGPGRHGASAVARKIALTADDKLRLAGLDHASSSKIDGVQTTTSRTGSRTAFATGRVSEAGRDVGGSVVVRARRLKARAV